MVKTVALLVEAVNLGQKNGAYTFDQAEQIAPAMRKAIDFLKASQEEQAPQAQQAENAPMTVVQPEVVHQAQPIVQQ